MSWTDKVSLQTLKQLRDDFKIRFFLETGTFKAINAIVQSDNFDYVFTCENNPEFLAIIDKKIQPLYNIYCFNSTSSMFLKHLKPKIDKSNETILVYLDAHFYNPNLPIEKRFVVLDELDELVNTPNVIIVVHDFDNGQFGHITYDGINLDLALMKSRLLLVNPNFKFYTNTECDVYNETNIGELIKDTDALDNIKYANSSPQKRDRGILYAIPSNLNIDLSKYKLREMQ